MLTDHQGTIVALVDTLGITRYRASFDAWGNRTSVVDNTGISLYFQRGYTGHEMLPEFGLINMNGRMYDPLLGRFLSPDRYVQLPDNSQNFNRYSYCLNNPLKYTDPSGELLGIDDLVVSAVAFAIGYAANGISSGDWGFKSVISGLCCAVSCWIGYNIAGLATGSINSSTWDTIASTGINAITNMFVPSLNIPIGDFNISISHAFGFGEGCLNIGITAGLSYSSRNWNFSLSTGAGSTYSGWFAEVGYRNFSVGFGMTYYNETEFAGYTMEHQKVGTGKLSWGNASFTLSNDLFAEHEDRWRTSAAELAIGDFLIGTSIITNNGKSSSGGDSDHKRNDPYVGSHLRDKSRGVIGAWPKGEVLHAPVWVGYRQGNIVSRVGVSAKIVQSVTQNLVHKFMKTPYYLNYNNFKNGAFSYYGSYNTLTLWNH